MIRNKNYDRFLAAGLKHVQNLADLVVNIRDVGEIPLARAADMVGRHLKPAPVAGVHQALGMGVHILIGQRGRGFEFRRAFVEIPVFLAGYKGVMGVGKAGRQAPGTGVKPAGQII